MKMSAVHNELENIEERISSKGVKPEDLRRYESLSQEMEAYISTQGRDDRNHIMLVVPVADRPQHLENALKSILDLCESFHYGGKKKYFTKISVLIAEDSCKKSCRDRNKEIVEIFSQRGLRTIYFGLKEQKEILTRLSFSAQKELDGIVGDAHSDDFSHKGASITRNITYLKLNQIKDDFDNIIFYFIDSDQEFKVNSVLDDGNVVFYPLNYFHHLDRIFTDSDIEVFTGKVVGDPPVSPSVMAANFLDDVCSFLYQVFDCEPEGSCCFHGNRKYDNKNDAAYHDMADLFGFKIKSNTFDYTCNLELPHNNADCLVRFSSQLNLFFDGVHLTRKNYYQHENIEESIVAARTVYTGNYAFSKNALRYFIPFANLKLRMAGPTMGRLLKNKLGSRFVSAHLPMLHERTIDNTGQSEYRAGIQHTGKGVSLHGEFERQYFGDVMLFSVEELVKSGYPEKDLSRNDVETIVSDKEAFLRKGYSKKIQQVQGKIDKLRAICKDKVHTNDISMSNISSFIENMELNFSEESFAYQLVTNDNMESSQIKNIIDAILDYKNELTVWSKLLEQ
ncbi:hypothetical protein MNBD_GAMMA23-2286 [hydrothermal vent metagenome]|uniref:Uncharacterized protein n=1 Tax=hydrothermal vent metagenome TaxID=652676 RepID=A0A3B1AKW4_9ZZZZ